MKQFLVRVTCDWQDWVEAETEEEAIDQIIDDLGNIIAWQISIIRRFSDDG